MGAWHKELLAPSDILIELVTNVKIVLGIIITLCHLEVTFISKTYKYNFFQYRQILMKTDSLDAGNVFKKVKYCLFSLDCEISTE